MKTILKSTQMPVTVLVGGLVGLVLRAWLLTTGVDQKGLLVSGHPADVLTWLLTFLLLAAVIFACLPLTEATKYRFNFPASTAGAVGKLLAAAGIAVTSTGQLFSGGDGFTVFCAVLGILSAAALVFLAYCHWKGLHPSLIFHGLISIYVMFLLVLQCRAWGHNPQLQDYFFQLLATVCVMLACYQRAMFDANQGNRRSYAITHFAAAYFCIAALPGSDYVIFFLTCGIWMLTDLCRLTPMPGWTFSPKREED